MYSHLKTIKMEITGRLEVIKPEQIISDTFKKREFVIREITKADYPQLILMEIHQDKCGLLDSYKIGDMVKIKFNLRGRKWTNPEGIDKYFNSLNVWQIEKHKTVNKNEVEPNGEMAQAINDEGTMSDSQPDEENDLPF